ncbi:MAG: helix-turn-helix domain-containing protein [Clostridiales bacterium]|nr:helix-turn-helix domain-containing protein [Clostridiales bacterium]
MTYNIKEVAQRLQGLRLSCDLSIEDFCEKTGIAVNEYELIEKGEKDFSVSFIYKCSELFGVDLVEILTGVGPKLSAYSIVRKDKGLPIERRERFAYQHLAYRFKNKEIEPLLVKAPFDASEQDKPIKLSVHEGQEWDYVLKGSLKVVIGEHTEILNEGDSLYYNSNQPHGMIAQNGEDCEFLAVLIKK